MAEQEFGDVTMYVDLVKQKPIEEQQEYARQLFWRWHGGQGRVTCGAPSDKIERFAATLMGKARVANAT